MAEVVWLRQATQELIGAVAYIRQDNGSAARKLGGRLLSLGESLSRLPRRGRPTGDGTHERVSLKPYIIRTRVSDDGGVVTVLSVRRNRRGPL